MKSKSNNSSKISVDDQKPSYDSLICKSEINELEEIKTEIHVKRVRYKWFKRTHHS